MAPPRKPDSELTVPRTVVRQRGDRVRVQLHRLRAEKALGKPLPVGAVVHHADGSISDDAPLVICQDQAYHMLLHARMRVVEAGGDPNLQRLCAYCRKLVEIALMEKRNNGLARACKRCVADRTALYREKRTTTT